MRAKGTTEGRINMRGKDGVISDCRVFLSIIERDNNDTHAKEKKKSSVLNESKWSVYKICRGLFYLYRKGEVLFLKCKCSCFSSTLNPSIYT